jgi:hypothetical protein
MTHLKLAAPLLILALSSCSTQPATAEAWAMSITTRDRIQHAVNLSPLFSPDLFSTYVEESTPWKATLKAMPGTRLASNDAEGLEAVREEALRAGVGEAFLSLVSTDYWIEAKDGSTLDLFDSSWAEPLLQLGAALQEGFLESPAVRDGQIGSNGYAVLRKASTGPTLHLQFKGLDPWDQDFAASFRIKVHQEEGSIGRFFVQCFGWVGTRHEADSTTTE